MMGAFNYLERRYNVSRIQFDPRQMEKIQEFLESIPQPNTMTAAQLEEYEEKVEDATSDGADSAENVVDSQVDDSAEDVVEPQAMSSAENVTESQAAEDVVVAEVQESTEIDDSPIETQDNE